MIIELESKIRPRAEILNIDLKRGELIFRWVDGPYGGECSTALDITVIEAIAKLITPDVTTVLNVVAKDADAVKEP